MFRKHPEASQQWSLDNVKMCAKRQDMILDCAADMLNDGGRIVYSTCTFSSEEDDGSIERFLSRHPDFAVEKMHRIYPHTHKGEGHFAAVLTKIMGSRSLNESSDSSAKSKSKDSSRSPKIPMIPDVSCHSVRAYILLPRSYPISGASKCFAQASGLGVSRK